MHVVGTNGKSTTTRMIEELLVAAGLRVGATIQSGPRVDIRPGNALPLGDIPTGTNVHAVELRPGQGAKLARSGG